MRDAAKQVTFFIRYAMLRARLAALREEPVVVASTHRTASTAVYRSLRVAIGSRVFKCHRLHEPLMSWKRPDPSVSADGMLRNRMTGDWAVLHGITQPRRPARLVMMVRDPVAVAASMAAFEPVQNGAAWPLVQPFSNAMTDWFDADVLPALGWSPWNEPFDTERKAMLVDQSPWRILVLRADLDDGSKERELSRFVGATVRMVRVNSAEQRGAGSSHAKVLARLSQLPDEIDRVHRSKLCAHFFSPAELAAQRARWLSGN
ncbi:MAG: putative capsular polysaccharide synthesis family protein [Bacteroidia bacterium]|nr:putative capsular polysaccharide synthesis family protein [Bacteroidia bacterium]